MNERLSLDPPRLQARDGLPDHHLFQEHPWLGASLLLTAFWVAVGLLYAGMGYAAYTAFGEVPERFSVLWIVLGWCTWIPTSLIALALVRSFPLRADTWFYAAPVHLVGAALCAFFASFLYTSMRGLEALLVERPDFDYGSYLQDVFVRSVAIDSIIYLTVLVAVHTLQVHQKARERELQAAQLAAQLSEAQLHALNLQLQPHFLFNTFHAIAMLVRQHEEKAAVRTIAELSSFLRYVLDTAGTQEVTLQQELGGLRSYVEVEQVRFGQRLDVQMEADAEALRAQVPNLILQPLVENAVKHGLAPNGGGRIEVTARREGRRLHLRVMDDGVGLPGDGGLSENGSREGSGIGLENAQQRLERLYGTNYHFELSDAPQGGLVVTIMIPYRAAATPAADRAAVDAAPSSEPSRASHEVAQL